MKASNKISRKFTLRNYETDFDQKLKPSALLGYFQETAGIIPKRWGWDLQSLRAKGGFGFCQKSM